MQKAIALETSRSSAAQIEQKPEPKIGQNRKIKNHIGYQNRKTASVFHENRKPDAKKRKIRKPQWPPKPKTDLKNSLNRKNRKSQCPPPVVVSRKNPQGEWLLCAGLGWPTVLAIKRVKSRFMRVPKGHSS